MTSEIKSHGIAIVRATLDRSPSRFLFHFGAYGSTKVLVIGARSLENALDEAIDHLVDHAPGLLCDVEVKEEYDRLLAEGISEERAWERATIDTTCGGNCGNYLNSSEWSVWEDPTRDGILSIQRRPAELRAVGFDTLASRKPGYVARRMNKRAA